MRVGEERRTTWTPVCGGDSAWHIFDGHWRNWGAAVDLAATRPLSELEQQGQVKSFELSFELAWNTVKDFFTSRGVQNLYGSRDAVRAGHEAVLSVTGAASGCGWGVDGAWMEMIQSRNLSAHTYDAESATAIIQMVCEAYLQEFDGLYATLDHQRRLEDPS